MGHAALNIFCAVFGIKAMNKAVYRKKKEKEKKEQDH